MPSRRCLLVLLVAASLAAVFPPARAWWDTQIMALKEVPKVAEIEAEQAAPANGATVVADTPTFGPAAGGGQAVELQPGVGSLTWKLKLSRSVYKFLAIARIAAADPVKNGTPEWPLFARLKVTAPNGRLVGDWAMPINYLNSYYDTARMFFPAHEDGEYTVEFATTDESKAALLVDRLELRDELGNTAKQGFKQGRYLTTDDELTQMRRSFFDLALKTTGAADAAALKALLTDPAQATAAVNRFSLATAYRFAAHARPVLMALADGPVLPGREGQLDPTKRAERVAAFRQAWGAGYAQWNTPARGDWKVKDLDRSCLETGEPALALAAAQMLIRAADWYPALDWSAQVITGEVGNMNSRGVRFTFTNGRFGKIQYSMWEMGYPDGFAKVYDALFPFIVANADELAEMARVRVPWVQTRADLITFLDTRLLQYPGDCVNRTMIRSTQGGSETVMLHAIAVQGPNPAGERLARWLYTRTYWDMTNDGGIQDQAISGRLRDGANSIGSIGYTEGAGQVLVQAAGLMGRYVAAGGAKEFDLSDTSRFPAVLAGALFPLECRVAGGYHPRIGDWGRAMDPRVYGTLGKTYADGLRLGWRHTRDPRLAWLLVNAVGRQTETDAEWAALEQRAAGQRDPQLAAVSRNLEGFGLAILEAGVASDDFTKKRALTFRHGAGKGHAHADSLGLEFYAHGLRALPDAGNRGGDPHPGHMRAHLGVTVDAAGMRNSGEINVSGTAWTTAFAPAAGAPYVAGAARFAAAPQVTRYERQAALIDVAGADASYVFDVLRVAGGKSHTWHTHGPARTPEETPVLSFEAKPATSDAAKEVLAAHLAPREGVAGAVVSAAWPVAKVFEAKMLDAAFRADLPPVVTRCSLFGHAGAPVFVGDSSPDAKGLEGSQWLCTVGFLHVRKDGADGLQTVWPQLIESWRGTPYLKSATTLPVTPADATAAAPVALAVETTSGQRDLLVADGAGDRAVTAGTVTLVGRFGFVSRDAQGLRLAHLVGGTQLAEGDLKIAAEAAGYARQIVAVDYLNRRVTLDQPLPQKVAPGTEFLIGAPTHPQVWQTAAVQGATVTLARSAVLYQSEILTVNAAARELVCSMNPNLLLADPHYYDGVTAVAEAGDRTWRVESIRPKYLFMYLQEPLQDWRETYGEADFPDADGDGKRTVTFLNWGGGDGSPALAQVVVEVAFVDPVRQVIYFKLPEQPEVVAANGWQWGGSRLMDPAKGRWMVNEKGRRWIPNYTGKQHAITLASEVKDSAFTDADRDGRRVLRLYHFGVGDAVQMQTHVVVRRQADGAYAVEATTPATVALPGGRTAKP